MPSAMQWWMRAISALPPSRSSIRWNCHSGRAGSSGVVASSPTRCLQRLALRSARGGAAASRGRRARRCRSPRRSTQAAPIASSTTALAEAPYFSSLSRDALAQRLVATPRRQQPDADDHHQVDVVVHAQPGGVDARHALVGRRHRASSSSAGCRPLRGGPRCWVTSAAVNRDFHPRDNGDLRWPTSKPQFEQAVADSQAAAGEARQHDAAEDLRAVQAGHRAATSKASARASPTWSAAPSGTPGTGSRARAATRRCRSTST